MSKKNSYIGKTMIIKCFARTFPKKKAQCFWLFKGNISCVPPAATKGAKGMVYWCCQQTCINHSSAHTVTKYANGTAE